MITLPTRLVSTDFVTCSSEADPGLWGLKLIQCWGVSLRKRIRNDGYKIRYESEYLYRAPSKALEGAPP